METREVPTVDEWNAARKAAARKRHDTHASWGFIVAVFGVTLLLAVHLTAFGIAFVGAIIALVVWALYRY